MSKSIDVPFSQAYAALHHREWRAIKKWPTIREWCGIIAILCLATALRFADLERVPAALNVDEALNGYEAYSLLKTGRDEWGTPWPVLIRGFNDYRRPAIVYTAIPFVAMLGLSTFSIRATAATWGILTVLLTYCLARDMVNKQAGLLAALMLAVSPWHVHFSRSGREAATAIFTIVLGLWCGWRWYKKRQAGWLIGAGVAFGLSFYTYNTTQAFTPLMLAVCGLIFARTLWQHRHLSLATTAVLAVVSAPLLYAHTNTPYAQNRLDAVTVFEAGKPLLQSFSLVVRQWLGHFSPDYLFLHGDAHLVLHPAGFGQLYLVEAILLPLGALTMVLRQATRRAGLLLLAWLALGAVPAALTTQDMGSAHSLRGMLGVPAFAILSGQGFMALGNTHRIKPSLRTIGLGALAGLLALNAGIVLHHYFVIYPIQSALAYEYGIKQAVDYITIHEDEYDTIVLTDWISQPHIFAVYFQRYDPQRFQAEANYGHKLSAKLKRWGKYQAGDVEKLYSELEHGLFVARPHMLEGVTPTLTIYHPDGSPAFNVLAK
ncbi:MAG: glycosyltransferase family 39 protein [Thermoflexales bacterium]|nr:glycosyltransferase family 39 protein [Thermoflexales bacterium]